MSVSRPHARQYGRAGPRIDPPIDKGLIRSATSPGKPKSASSIPVARDKLLSNYPAAFRWTAPITRPEDSDWESMMDGDRVQSGLGNLGQRRGFKGKPLTVRKWSQSSSFLSLPRGLNLTPRSSSIASLDGAFSSSPRTPLGSMASRMRSVSLSVVSWSSGVKAPLQEVTQGLQELYDVSDPFASPGNTFFVLITDASTVPLHDPCQLGFYRQNGMTRNRSCIAKNVPHSAFTNARMKTTIYDLSTADIVPARTGVPAIRKNVIANLKVAESDVADGTTATNSPTIVLTAPPSPTEQQVDKDKTKLGGELSAELDVLKVPDNRRRILEERETRLIEASKVPRSALAAIGNSTSSSEQNQQDINGLTTPQSRCVLSVLPATGCFGDDGFVDVQLPDFKYAEFPKVVYEPCRPSDDAALVPFPGCTDTLAPCSFDSAPKRRSSLRPLVLPARVASRLSARIALVPEDDTSRSQGLEGIIALLDVGFTAQEM